MEKEKNKKEFRMGGNLKVYDYYIPNYNKHSCISITECVSNSVYRD